VDPDPGRQNCLEIQEREKKEKLKFFGKLEVLFEWLNGFSS
jgi:hypothetical protein